MERVVVGTLLAIQGFVHLRLWTVAGGRGPDPRHSWLLGNLGRVASTVGVAVGIALLASGAGYALEQDWWAPLAIVAGVASIALMVLVFNRWLLLGIALSAAVVAFGLAGLEE